MKGNSKQRKQKQHIKKSKAREKRVKTNSTDKSIQMFRRNAELRRRINNPPPSPDFERIRKDLLGE